jgi:subtilisin family serine protease
MLVSSTIVSMPLSASAANLPGQSATSKQAQPLSSKQQSKTTGSGKQPVKPNSALAVDDSLRNRKGNIHVVLQLSDAPALQVYNQARNTGSGNNTLAAAEQISRNQVNKIKQAQQTLLTQLQNPKYSLKVIYQVQEVYNGIAVIVDAKYLNELSKLPGVVAIHELHPVERDNASSVPLIGAPQVWSSYGITGTNVKIGIIDTGIDYVHTNFGGPGTAGAYAAANAITATVTVSNVVMYGGGQLYPNNKVAGGFDLAGDDYNADPNSPSYNPIPTPDGNPEDCSADLGGGHGSHVAGSAAGYGVALDGTTYHGPYNSSINPSSVRIGPGVAPGAKLYAFRVFGCQGSTDLVVPAIERAVDPDQNGNPSDHMDVVNMSLGSNFGDINSPDSAATDLASQAGVVMVISAGNAGDASYVLGSPGNTVSAVTVAASADAVDYHDGFRVNPPNSIAGVYPADNSAAYPWSNPGASPSVSVTIPVTATLYYPTSNPSGCSAFSTSVTDTQAIAGKIVLLDWVPTGFSTFPCGSAGRSDNMANLGAVGVIIVDQGKISTAITGSSHIPAQITDGTTGNKLKTAMAQGTVSVTLSNQYHLAVTVNDPTQVDQLASFSSRGPRADSLLKPDITAPGVTILSTMSGSGNQAMPDSGTSMAAPHVTGAMALLRQKNPNWTVEELKALAMNTAAHSVYSGTNQTGVVEEESRAGAGRVDVANAINDQVVAYSADTVGAVSVSFGFVEVTGDTTIVRNIKVVNKTNHSVTYTANYNQTFAPAGTTVVFPDGPNVTVPANGSANLRVQLKVTASQLNQPINPSETTVQSSAAYGDNGRAWLSELNGRITLVPSGTTTGPNLRVPIYANLRPASSIVAGPALAGGSGSVNDKVYLSGKGYYAGLTSTAFDANSQVSMLELQGINSTVITQQNGVDVRAANIKYVGAATDAGYWLSHSQPVTNSNIYFGIATRADWASLSAVEFDIYIDVNNDNQPDFMLYNGNTGTSSSPTDSFVAKLVDLNSSSVIAFYPLNYFLADEVPTAQLNNNVIVLPVDATTLGLQPNVPLKYQVYSFSSYVSNQIDHLGTYTFNWDKPGLDATGGYSGLPIWVDTVQGLDVIYNSANYTANNDQGLLLLHHFNTAGQRDQVLPVAQPCGGATSDTVVTTTGDDANCGSLRHALAFANNAVNKTVTFSLGGTPVINLLSTVALAPNIVLDGGNNTCTNGPTVTLQGNASAGDGLLVSYPVSLFNLKVRGFGGRQMVVQGGHVSTKCFAASKS